MGRYIDVFKIKANNNSVIYGLSMKRDDIEFFARVFPKEKHIFVYTDSDCTELFYMLDMSTFDYRKKMLGDGIKNQTFLLGLLQLIKAMENDHFPDDLSKQYG